MATQSYRVHLGLPAADKTNTKKNMAKSTKRNSLIKLVSAVSVTIFSLLVSFTGVFAWFLTINAVDNPATDITLENAGEFNFDYSLYYFDNDHNQVVKEDEGQDGLDLSLRTYDTSLSEDNTKFNNILRFQIVFASQDENKTRAITIKFTCDSTTIGAAYSPESTDVATRTFNDTKGYKFHYAKSDGTTGDFICDNISNLIQFKCFVYSYVIDGTTYTPNGSRPGLINTTSQIDLSTDTTVYNTASAIFGSQTSVNRFINAQSKSNEFTLTYNQIPGNVTRADFYVEYNYNSELLTQYIRNNEYLKNRTFGDDFNPADISLDVTFLKDISEIRLGTVLS